VHREAIWEGANSKDAKDDSHFKGEMRRVNKYKTIYINIILKTKMETITI